MADETMTNLVREFRQKELSKGLPNGATFGLWKDVEVAAFASKLVREIAQGLRRDGNSSGEDYVRNNFLKKEPNAKQR